MQHDVFISYPNQNKLVAGAVCVGLENQGIRCWIAPRNVQAGRDWAEAIIEGIENSRVMVLVFSAYANSSPYMMREVERAVSNGLIIIPLRLENIPYSKKLELFVSACQMLDAIELPLQAHIDTLAITIARLLSGKEQSSGKTGDEIDSNIRTELVKFKGPIAGFDVLPYGQGIVVCYSQEACVLTEWPPTSQERRLKIEGEDITSCAVSADGQLLAVGNCFASVSVYRLLDGDRITTFHRPVTKGEVMRFKQLGIGEDSFEYGEVTFSPDGRYLAACRRVSARDEEKVIYPHRIEAIDEPVDVFGLYRDFNCQLAGYGCSPTAHFSRDSRYIIVGLELYEGDNLVVYDVEQCKKVYAKHLNGYVRGIAVHPDGKQVIASLSGDDTRSIRFLSMTSGKERASLSYHAIPDNGRYPCADSVCIDSTGCYLASAHNCGVLRLWDVRRRILLRTWLSNSHGLWVDRLRFSCSGDYLFASFKSFPDMLASDQLAVVRMSDLLKEATPLCTYNQKGEFNAS
jgi:hypothetical protein